MIGGVKHQWSDRKLRVRLTPTGPLEDAYVCNSCGTARQIRSSAPSCGGAPGPRTPDGTEGTYELSAADYGAVSCCPHHVEPPTCSEQIQTDEPTGPWGFESRPCGERATRVYRWRNIGLNQTAHKCDAHAPAFEVRAAKEGIRLHELGAVSQ